MAREHFRTFSEIAISSAALIYFTGFVYLYYYYATFGVSLFAIQVAPQHVLTFAYRVLTYNGYLTAVCAVAILLLIAAYGTCVEWLNQLPQAIESDDPAPFRTVFIRGTVRRLLPLLGGVLIIVMFPLSFWWAQAVAGKDGALLFQEVHEGAPKHLHVVEVETGVLYTTAEFNEIIKAVNEAGGEGRAISIAESADRLFILVGARPRDTDNPMRRLPGDRIFAIEKSGIAVEERGV